MILVAHTVPLLSRADLYFPAQEVPECVPRVRAAEANREPSARRRGGASKVLIFLKESMAEHLLFPNRII